MRRNSEIIVLSPSTLRREGIARILRSCHFRDVICASDLKCERLSELIEDAPVLLVISADDDLSAAERQLAEFQQRFASGRIIALAEQPALSDMIRLYRAGANAYISNFSNNASLIKVIELVLLGETFVPAELLSDYLRQARQPEPFIRQISGQPGSPHTSERRLFSGQESRILQHIACGDSNKIIARRMNIAEATVKAHMKAILRKLGLRNRTEAAIWAIKTGGFSLGDQEAEASASSPLPAQRASMPLHLAG